MTELRDAALAYLARGWSVIPAHTVRDGACSCRKPECSSPGKHPRIAGYHGYEAQRAEQAEVEAWWTKWPDANIAVITGAISGVVVVDADPRHGGDDSLHDLALPETLRSLTGGGGDHLWYQHPGYVVPNHAGLRPGIDFRGDGGYVIAPPSHTQREYAWELSSPSEPAPFGAELRELLAGHKVPVGDPGLPSSVGRPFDLTGILARRIPHGERDATLTQIAGHFAGQGDDLPDIILKLSGVNALYCVDAQRKAADPLPFEDIERIARSIWQKERRKEELTMAVEARLNGNSGEEVPEATRRDLAREAWSLLGVVGVEDWLLVIGQKDQYVILMDDEEIPLGESLFNLPMLKMRVLNRTGKLLNNVAAKEWPRRAALLRGLARVVHAETTTSHEQVDDWITEFRQAWPVRETKSEERKSDMEERAILIDGRLYLRPAVLKKFIEGRSGQKMDLPALHQLLKIAGWETSVVRSGDLMARAWREPLGAADASAVTYARGENYRK